ncbi:MAG TPA: DUF2378 family protein [Polyangia bacterium]
MATAERSVDAPATNWGDSKITVAQANEFARSVTPVRADQEAVARNLLLFPPAIKVRGIFFEGVSRIVADSQGPDAMAGLVARAGIAAKTTAFRAYPHRDFYKLYYLAARLLHPTAPLAEAIRLTARTFFPIFKSSMLGRTMSALMGDRPTTILPLLARAYNVSVEGNDHQAELAGPKTLSWRCDVEPVEWYTETFMGIVEGAMPPDVQVRFAVEERGTAGILARYRFRIDW